MNLDEQGAELGAARETKHINRTTRDDSGLGVRAALLLEGDHQPLFARLQPRVPAEAAGV